MTSTNDDPQQEDLLTRTVKFILPVEEDEVFPPPDEASYWADCQMAFREGLALGLLKPDVARRLLAEIISETAERDRPLFGLVQMGEGGPPPSLSGMDFLTRTHVEQAAQQTAEFVQGELGL